MIKRSKQRRGAVAVEFAVVAPIFLLLVFALFEFARLLMLQQALTDASREGCRIAGLASSVSTAEVEETVRSYLQSVVGDAASDAATVHVTLPSSLQGVPSGTDLTVGVEIRYADVSWLPLGYLDSNSKISAEARRKRE